MLHPRQLLQLQKLPLQAPFLCQVAMATLQNAAAVASTHDNCDDVILAVFSAVHAHHAQSGEAQV